MELEYDGQSKLERYISVHCSVITNCKSVDSERNHLTCNLPHAQLTLRETIKAHVSYHLGHFWIKEWNWNWMVSQNWKGTFPFTVPALGMQFLSRFCKKTFDLIFAACRIDSAKNIKGVLLALTRIFTLIFEEISRLEDKK